MLDWVICDELMLNPIIEITSLILLVNFGYILFQLICTNIQLLTNMRFETTDMTSNITHLTGNVFDGSFYGNLSNRDISTDTNLNSFSVSIIPYTDNLARP